MSDLHIINHNDTYPVVLKNMLCDIEKQCKLFDTLIIVVSGDIIDKANYNDVLEQIILSFFQDLRDKLKNKKVYIDFVPGNHDKKQTQIDNLIVDKYMKQEESVKISDIEWNYNMISYRNYIDLINKIIKIFDNTHDDICDTSYIEDINIRNFHIILINIDTSWCSCGKGGDNDKGKLRVEENHLLKLKREYMKVVSGLDDTKFFTIAVAHHPLNWLKASDENLLHKWFLDKEFFNVNAFLCGHTHDRHINNICDSLNEYMTLVTGVGWNREDVEREKERHRYSIYKFNLINNVCEIIIRKTNSNLSFSHDYDILITKEDKERKKLLLPIISNKRYPYLEIPIYNQGKKEFEYTFIDNTIINKTINLSAVVFDMGLHMQKYLEMYIRDFFIKFNLINRGKATAEKYNIYEGYFYKDIKKKEAKQLFDNIKDKKFIYENMLSYLQQFCKYFSLSLYKVFPESGHIRCHFRRYYSASPQSILYITFCQGSSIETDDSNAPEIRDVDYTNSLIECCFNIKTSLVYSHNIDYNKLEVKKWNNFITIIPCSNNNKINPEKYTILSDEKQIPIITCAISIQNNVDSIMLDVLNYMNIDKIITQIIENYTNTFHIDLSLFIQYLEEKEHI